jgi:hypothetical protein
MKHKVSGYISKLSNNSLANNNIHIGKNSQKSFNLTNDTNSFLTYPSNINDSSQKKSKKHLFKSVYTGYSKKAFGSIPYKTENFLISDKINNKRFNDVKSIFYFDHLGNPGVGKYDLSKDFSLPGWSMKFGGDNIRFKTSFNEIPGVGDYNIENNKILEDKRNNIRYKSLFKKSTSKKKLLNIQNDNDFIGPTSTTYSPVYQDDIIKLKKLYNFDSFIGRDKYTGIDMPFSTSKTKNYPGPGFYTQNANIFGSSKNKQLKFSYEDKDKEKSYEESEIKKNPDKAVKKKYYTRNDFPNFKLKSRSPKYNDIKIMTSEEVMKNKSETKKIKRVNILDELLKKKPDLQKSSNYLKFKIDQERELEYIKSILGNDNGRPDLFYLSSPRWKENKYQLKTPGPAYYFNYFP